MHYRIQCTVLLSLALTLAWGVVFAADRAEANEPAEREADAAALLADQFVIMMNDVLAGENSPRPDQLTRARILLDQALALRDDDPELWRLRAELATRMEDRDAYGEAMRRYMRLRPSDDAAQLDRLLAGLADQQTLDDRLSRLEAILQSRSAQQLSAPLRSRLATHAALAAQELNDDARLDHWLTEAARLDPANPDAAELVYALAQHKDSSPAARGAALVALIKASPADPSARLRLARWLTTQAVYHDAEQQFNSAATLAGGGLPADVYPYRVIALAASGDAAEARTLLDQIAPLPDEDDEEGIDGETQPAIRLSLELLRLALHEDQPELTERSFDYIQSLLDAGSTGDDRPAWLGEDDSVSPEVGRQRMLAWVAAVFTHQLDDVPELLAAMPDDDPLVRRARGWMHLHLGEAGEAAAQFKSIADEDPLAALGMARLLDAGSPEQAEALQTVVHRDGGGLAGLLAARQLLVGEHTLQQTSAGSEIRRQMSRGPLQLWQPALNVSPWVTMNLRIAPENVGYLEPLHATLELRNTSRVPMPIRAGRGVPERALISPALSVGGEPLPRPAPTIVDVRRRLTLAAGETLRVTVRLDRSQLGLLMFTNPARTLSLNALGVLGPRSTRTGGVTADPAGGVDSVRAITIRGTPISNDRLEQWVDTLDSDDAADQLRALASLLRGMDHLPDELDTRTTHRRIAEAITSRFPQWDEIHQAWAVRFVTSSRRSRELFRRILESAERSDTPLIRLAFLATHVDDDASAALNAALRHDDPTIQTYAEGLRDALEAGNEDPSEPAAPAEDAP